MLNDELAVIREGSGKEERIYRQIFENSLDAILIGNPGSRQIMAANPAACTLFGMTEAELCAAGPAVIEDPADTCHAQTLAGQARNNQVRYNVALVRKDGSKFLAEISSAVLAEGLHSVVIRDITEQQQTEAALIKSRKNLVGILESMPDAFVSFDHQLRYTYVNATAERYQLASREQLLGKDVREVYPDPESYKSIRMYEKVLRDHKEVTFTSYHAGFDAWMEIQAFPTPEGVSVFYKDVSEQIKADEALHESEQRLKYHFENSPLAVVEWDSNYLVTRWSIEAERIFGWKKDEVIGKRIDTLNMIHPDDIPVVEKTMGRLSSGKELTVVSSNRNMTKVGAVIECIWYHSVLLGKNGEMRSVVSLVEDVTDRKKAEEVRVTTLLRFYRILSNIHSGVLLVTNDDKVEFANQAFCRLFNLKEPPEELAGLAANDMIAKIRSVYGDPDAAIARIGELVALGQPARGEVVDTYNRGTLLRDFIPIYIDGKPYGRLWVHVEITELRRMQDELKQQADDLTKANAELESFSYSLSHDLRTPLRGISGFCGFLRLDYGDILGPEGMGYLDHISNSANKMNDLIEDMLTLAKISRQEIAMQDTDLSAIAESVIDDLQRADPARKVEVEIAKELKAQADGRLMHIALSNLIGNAWKYSGKNPAARIEFGAMEGHDGEKIFFVRDNGAGFDMKFESQMFVPFRRFHSESQFPGTGVGLALVNRVIRRHNGRVWGCGEIGKGATFYFTLSAAGG